MQPQQQAGLGEQSVGSAVCCVCLSGDVTQLAPVCTTNSGVIYYMCLACERRDGLLAPADKTFQCIKCQRSFATEHEVPTAVVTVIL